MASLLFRRLRAAAAGAACASATACAHLDPPPPPPAAAWAHPSPYDPATPPQRYAPVQHLRGPPPRREWDLPGLLAAWRASPSEETWPWVWTQPNAAGPHHVFLGFGPDTLSHIALARADARNNLPVVLPEAGEEDGDALARHGATEAQLFELGCAVIRANVAQLDAGSKLLLLSDERIVAFDYAHLA